MSKKMIFFKNMMGQKKRSTFSHVNHIFKCPTLLTNRNISNNLNLLYRHLCKNKTNLRFPQVVRYYFRGFNPKRAESTHKRLDGTESKPNRPENQSGRELNQQQ